MLAYVVTQQGAQKLLDRTKGGKFRIPVDGYPFNKGLNKGLEVFANMHLYVYTHNALNDHSDKDAVTHATRRRLSYQYQTRPDVDDWRSLLWPTPMIWRWGD